MSFSKAAVAATIVLGLATPAAAGATTPGWECIPTTAGQAVVSGGTSAAPSCGAGTTAVLAPTFVSSGVGGKPTVQFASVNVQIISGAGATDAGVNGTGNLVLGYGENANSYSQTGSHDLVIGKNNGWSGFGEIVGGNNDRASGNYSTVVGKSNLASGGSSLAAGEVNTASGGDSSVMGGAHNIASGSDSSITGGNFNAARDSFASILGGCLNLAGASGRLSGSCNASGTEAVLGGFENTASGLESTVSGGEVGNAVDQALARRAGCSTPAVCRIAARSASIGRVMTKNSAPWSERSAVASAPLGRNM